MWRSTLLGIIWLSASSCADSAPSSCVVACEDSDGCASTQSSCPVDDSEDASLPDAGRERDAGPAATVDATQKPDCLGALGDECTPRATQCTEGGHVRRCECGYWILERLCGAGQRCESSDPLSQARCATTCGAGAHINREVSDEADRTCEACASGSWNSLENTAQCDAWQDCPPGSYETAPGSEQTDRVCQACPEGQFSGVDNAASCEVWPDCPAGSFIEAPGSAVQAPVCTPCPEGSVTLQPNRTSCSPVATQIVAGGHNTCVLLAQGDLLCWGGNDEGELGQGPYTDWGDDEHPYLRGRVPLDERVGQLAMGGSSMCALLESGRVFCWGSNNSGALGPGSVVPETRVPPSEIKLGGKVKQLSLGSSHACALLESGKLRCWGDNSYGSLGYGHEETLGDEPGEMPPPDVDLEAEVVQVAAGSWYTCALLKTGHVRCWGDNRDGQLGYPSESLEQLLSPPRENVAVDIDVAEGLVEQIVVGDRHVCARLKSGRVVCWGSNEQRQLDAQAIEGALDLTAGGYHTCALTKSSTLHCWGRNASGRTGQGTAEFGRADVALPVGANVRQVVTGHAHTCVLLHDKNVRCWGEGDAGKLGYGDVEARTTPPEQNVLYVAP